MIIDSKILVNQAIAHAKCINTHHRYDEDILWDPYAYCTSARIEGPMYGLIPFIVTMSRCFPGN